MAIRFAPEAEADFHEAVAYIAEKNSMAARKLSDRIFQIEDELARGDFDGP